VVESNSSATLAAASAAGMVTITGGLFGMPFDTLIVGFLAGLVALSFQGKMSYIRMLSTVFSSSMLAGSFAPVWTAVAFHYVPFLASIGAQAANVASAAAIGVCAQTLVPIILERLKSIASSFVPGGPRQ
jgi:LytS/YehU family sensor histidine kinase